MTKKQARILGDQIRRIGLEVNDQFGEVTDVRMRKALIAAGYMVEPNAAIICPTSMGLTKRVYQPYIEVDLVDDLVLIIYRSQPDMLEEQLFRSFITVSNKSVLIRICSMDREPVRYFEGRV